MDNRLIHASEVAEELGVSVPYAYKIVKELNEELIYDTTVYTTDYLHPNPGGYDIIAPYVADFMREMTKPDPAILKKVY